MRFKQIKEIIEHARGFHKLIADYYRQLSEQTERERMKMLLKYLEQHERTAEKALADYETDASQKTLKSWSKYSACEDKLGTLKNMLSDAATSPDDVIRLAIGLDECLLSMYRELADTSNDPDVAEALQNLLSLETSELRILARDSLKVYDM